jgi:hypothetical protein
MNILLKILFSVFFLVNTYCKEENKRTNENHSNELKEELNIQVISKICLSLYSQIQDFALKEYHATSVQIGDMNSQVSKILDKYDLNSNNNIELKEEEIVVIVSNIQKILKILQDFSRYNFGEVVVSSAFCFNGLKDAYSRLNLIATKFNDFIAEKENSQGAISELINSSGAIINIMMSACSLIQKISASLSKGAYEKSFSISMFYKKNKKEKELKKQQILDKLFEIIKKFQTITRIVSSLDCVNDSMAPLVLNEAIKECIKSLSIINILLENSFKDFPSNVEIEKECKKTLGVVLKKCKQKESMLERIVSLKNIIKELGKKEEKQSVSLMKYYYRYLYLKMKSPFRGGKVAPAVWNNFLTSPKALISTYFGLSIFCYLKDFKISPLYLSGDIVCSLYETIYSGTIGMFKGGETLNSKDNVIQNAFMMRNSLIGVREKAGLVKIIADDAVNKCSSDKMFDKKESEEYKENEKYSEMFQNIILTKQQKEILKILDHYEKTSFDILKNNDIYSKQYEDAIKKCKTKEEKAKTKKDFINKNANLLEEDIQKKLIPLMASHGIKDFINTYSDVRCPELGNFGKILGSLALSIISIAGIAKIDSESKILPAISSGFTSLHDWMLGKDADLSIKQTNVESDASHSELTIYSPAFKALADRNDLDWFYQVMDRIKNPYSFNDTNFPRAIMIEGPSGSGKTFFTKAFAQTISNLKNEISELKEVMFIEVEPKHLYIDERNANALFELITQQIDENRFTTNVIILYLDEFHLFFTDRSGHLSSERVANFLKLFSDLKQKQKNTPGGVYMVVSTNKSEFIPYEILENPDRIANVIRIDYPTYFERISIISNYIKKTGNQSDNIDLNYISSILEGLKISQGKLIKIIDLALAKSRMRHKVINTEVMYEAINELGRRILYDKNPIHPRILNSLSLYYAAKAALSINFNSERIQQFDSATLYPVKFKRIPKSLKDMYQKSNNYKLVYGTAFYSNMANNIPLLSLRETVINILKELAGKVYCRVNNVDMATQSIDDLKNAFHNAYVYFSLDNYDALNEIQGTKVKFSKDGNKKKNLYTNQKVIDVSQRIMNICEIVLEKFFKNIEILDFVFDISNLLKENKIV